VVAQEASHGLEVTSGGLLFNLEPTGGCGGAARPGPAASAGFCPRERIVWRGSRTRASRSWFDCPKIF